MTHPLRVAGAVCRGGMLGSAAALGVLSGQTWLTRTRIPVPCTRAPETHGTTWGSSANRTPLHAAFLGDSLAAGFGVDEPGETLAAVLATRLSTATRRNVHVSNHGRIGARSRDLRAQLAELTVLPDLAVILVGANDVTHHVRTSEAVRHLSYAAHRLRLMDAALVVGTCPDLGTVRPIVEPLRTIARRLGCALAAAQADVTRRAGGVPVPLGGVLGDRFASDPTLFSGDGFHPSAAGYAATADAILPSALAALGGSATYEEEVA